MSIKKNKKSILFAILCVLAFEIIFNVLAYLKFGNGYLLQDYLYIAVILWAVLLFFFFRYCYDKYYEAKSRVFSSHADKQKIKQDWQIQKRLFTIKVFKLIAYIFGAATPLYLLAYLDDSQVLKSKMYVPILFFCIALFALIASKVIKVKENES